MLQGGKAQRIPPAYARFKPAPPIRFRDAEEWVPAFAGTPIWARRDKSAGRSPAPAAIATR
jgi:hypothetical protein